MMDKIIQNAFEYGGVIYNSVRVHDFVETPNGEYFTDGGLEYIRRNFSSNGVTQYGDMKDLTLTGNSTLSDICDNLVWGTYGIDGNQPLTWIRIKDMTIDHQMAVLENCKNIGSLTKFVLQYWINQFEKFKRMGVQWNIS